MPIKLLRYIVMPALAGLLGLLLARHAPEWLIALGVLGGVGMAVELSRHEKQKGRPEAALALKPRGRCAGRLES